MKRRLQIMENEETRGLRPRAISALVKRGERLIFREGGYKEPHYYEVLYGNLLFILQALNWLPVEWKEGRRFIEVEAIPGVDATCEFFGIDASAVYSGLCAAGLWGGEKNE